MPWLVKRAHQFCWTPSDEEIREAGCDSGSLWECPECNRVWELEGNGSDKRYGWSWSEYRQTVNVTAVVTTGETAHGAA